MSVGRGLIRRADEQGLTLVELLFAFTIFSVAVLGVVGMFPVAAQHLRAGGDLTKATGLAQRMVEQLRDEPIQVLPRYHNADTREAASFPPDDPGETPPFRGGSSLRHWQDEITAASLGWGKIEVSALDRRLSAITVTVGWTADFTERLVQLTTYIGQQ